MKKKVVSLKQMTKPEWRAIYDKSLENHLKYFSVAAKKLGVHPIDPSDRGFDEADVFGDRFYLMRPPFVGPIFR